MDQVILVLPGNDQPAIILEPAPTPVDISVSIGMPGPPGPGIASNISRITASTSPPANPENNDLWIDLS